MSGFELKTVARKLMRENSPKVFLVSIMFIILVTVMSNLEYRLPGTLDAYEHYLEQLSAGELQNPGMIYSYLRPSGVPFAFILWLLSAVVTAGYKSYCLKLSRGQKAEYGDVFNGFLFFGKAIFIKIITNILVALWSLLFIFPGISAYYRYRQAYYILIDDPEKSVLECINESKRLMRGNKLDLFLLDLSFIGWWLLDYLVILFAPIPFPLPLVSIWLTPYFNVTNAAFYNRLINNIAV